MEEQWYADRARLRLALREHPEWSAPQLARHLGRSVTWTKKWRRRLAMAPPDDEAVLASRSRARHRRPPSVSQLVVDRILALRDQPPGNLQRVPGPKTIRYFLERDTELRAAGADVPHSTATIWQVLRRHGRIAQRRPRHHEPVDRPSPLTSWQMDFKDISTVPAEEGGKRQHIVESLTCVDCGTSLLVEAQVRDDFTEETTLLAVADLLRRHGLPTAIRIDRDPRFVGSPGNQDFPSPLVRFLTCLGVEVTVNPPRRPDLSPFVERLHGSYERECLRVYRPRTLEHAREVTAAFRQHYNHERPNQALSCGNRPPRVAFPALPLLPPVPTQVDPDRWLERVGGRHYLRTVLANGTVTVEQERYYVGRPLAGQRVVLAVAAGEGALVVRHQQREVKRFPIKGLRRASMAFEEYVALMQQEARARDRRARRPRAAAA